MQHAGCALSSVDVLVFQVKLNLHGVVGVESAQQIEEEEYEETVKVYEPASSKVISPTFLVFPPSQCMSCKMVKFN